MAFQAEIRPIGENRFYQNGMVFASREEATAYAKDLYSRWTQAEEWQVVETDRGVTYQWDFTNNKLQEN